MKAQLSEAQNHRCAYCGIDLLDDSQINEIGDMAFLACRPCTEKKGEMSAMDFWHGRHLRPKKKRRVQRKKWRSKPALKERLSESQNHRCCYCGEKMTFASNNEHQATVEHVIERSQGGSDGWDNLVSCCLTCNLHRNEMKVSAEAYFSYIQENGRFINGKKFLKKEETCTIQEFGNSTTSQKRPPLLLRILRFLKGLFLP